MCDTDEKSLWYALQVVPEKENIVATLLGCKGYEQFVPTYQTDDHFRRKLKTGKKLFPGYVFCRFAYEARNRMRDGGGVVTIPGIIRIVGGIKPAPIPWEEIEAIRLALATKLTPKPWPFQVGEKVKIETGPLRGISGMVVRSDRTHRLVLSVELLRRSVAVTVEPEWISPTAVIHKAIDNARAYLTQQQIS